MVSEKLDYNQIAQKVSELIKVNVIPEFAESPVPMKVAAKVLHMDPNEIRNRMDDGTLDIGNVFHSQKKRGVRSYRRVYISPKKFWEVTGYVWKGGGTNDDPESKCD